MISLSSELYGSVASHTDITSCIHNLSHQELTTATSLFSPLCPISSLDADMKSKQSHLLHSGESRKRETLTKLNKELIQAGRNWRPGRHW